MVEVAKIVARSLRLLRVNDVNEAPEAEDFESAIDALNAMMQRWEANGLSLGWQNIRSPGDTLPAPPEAVQAIIFNLALTIRPEYGVSLDPDVVEVARESLAALRRDVLVANPLVLKRRLPQCGNYNIYTDLCEDD